MKSYLLPYLSHNGKALFELSELHSAPIRNQKCTIHISIVMHKVCESRICGEDRKAIASLFVILYNGG